MTRMTRPTRLVFVVLACLPLLEGTPEARGGGRKCQRCGSKQEVKAVCRLVKVCQQIEMPLSPTP